MEAEEIISKNKLLPGAPEILRVADKRMSELVNVVGEPSSTEDILAMDYSGIGDACCHARLILQHLVAKGNRITWIATKKVGCLFRDDNEMRVLEGFYNPFRIPFHEQVSLSNWLNAIFEERFPKWKKFNVSHFVMSRYFGISSSNISEAFFNL